VGPTVTNIKEVDDEIRSWINPGNCSYSFQKLLSFHLLSRLLKIRMYKTITQ